MATLSKDSYDIKACAPQAESMKRSMPFWALGKETRQKGKNVYISEKHSADVIGRDSPGPVYNPSQESKSSKFSFGTGPARTRHLGGMRTREGVPKYPEPSTDLIGSIFDAQEQKFTKPRNAVFGTENREAEKNCPGLETFPEGKNSPGPQVYAVDGYWLEGPRYTLGARTKVLTHACQTPARVGPGIYKQAEACGDQASSIKKTLPQWSFGKSDRFKYTNDSTKTGTSHDALGKGALKFHRMNSAPVYGFGTSTREHTRKVAPANTPADAGPKGSMGSGHVRHPSLPTRKEWIKFTNP